MNFDIKFNLKFVIITLIVSLVIVPILFNILFMWDSGLSRGETSDWFTLYGNIIGGLIGGFFTYLALLLTFKEQKNTKKNEMRPKVDIPHQTIEFIKPNGNTINFEPIKIELNNIGGSIAKNIECILSLPNYDEVLIALEKNKTRLGIAFVKAQTYNSREAITKDYEGTVETHLMVRNDDDKESVNRMSLGYVKYKYDTEFIGSCIPLLINYEAKTHYILENNVSHWISYIIQKRSSIRYEMNKNELFNLNLEIKYHSDEYGEFCDTFNLEWEYIGLFSELSNLKSKYVLKSTKVNKQEKVNHAS
ncbi:hypothetical protein ABEY41_19185 [Peribacillus butanolivorans]|uniref:hypothetical protein n=1 Tax=Peribacillus butanolivorans TaxID=421767 RepID=UPI003D2E41DF